MSDSKTYITASSLNKLLSCPRAFYYRYELGLQPVQTDEALSFGSAFHTAMEARNKGLSCEDAKMFAFERVSDNEQTQATLAGLIEGYYVHYKDDNNDFPTTPELRFEKKLKGVRNFHVSGVIDGLCRTPSGDILREYKTTGASVAPDSDYWERLRFNVQLMTYVDALESYGYSVTKIIYDVVRKPSIRPKQNEVLRDYAVRLAKDCVERPEFYFARRTVSVLHDDMAEFLAMRKELCKQIVFMRYRSQHLPHPHYAWVKNCNATTCQFCEFKSFCLSGGHASQTDIPVGFYFGTKNPELQIQK